MFTKAFSKSLGLAAAAAALTLGVAASSSAWSVHTGNKVVSTCTQNGTLSNGDTFTLYTDVLTASNSNLYTYQYDLKNINDTSGLTKLAASFDFAPDYGTKGMTFFFGNAPDSTGTVYHDGPVGNSYDNTLNNNNPITNSGSIDYQNHTPTMEAYADGSGQIIFQALPGNALPVGADSATTVGNYNDPKYGSFGYFYVQTTAAPVQSGIFVSDAKGAGGGVTDCAGTCPCGCTTPPAVPEPGSVGAMGLGGLSLIGLLLRARKRVFQG